MKHFTSLAGAHQYAINASKKYEDYRYVYKEGNHYYVYSEEERPLGGSEGLIETYFMGEKEDLNIDENE